MYQNPSLTRRVSVRLSHHRWFAAFSRRLISPADRWLYRISGGRLSPVGRSVVPVLLLTTVGRRTGRPRTTPLMYIRDGDRYIVSSEDYGQARPAGWRLNLEACPGATIQIGREKFDCRARLLSDEEADRHWPALLQAWPAHQTYRRRNGRRYTFELVPEQPDTSGFVRSTVPETRNRTKSPPD